MAIEDLPEAYLEGMLNGIIGLDNAVTRLEGKFKLSQIVRLSIARASQQLSSAKAMRILLLWLS